MTETLSQPSGTGSRLRQVGTEKIVSLNNELPPSQPPLIDKIATDMILLGIKTLSQKTLVAFSQLFTVLATASAFVLWYVCLPTPTVPQLIGLGLYGAFLLLLEVIRRRGN